MVIGDYCIWISLSANVFLYKVLSTEEKKQFSVQLVCFEKCLQLKKKVCLFQPCADNF